MLTETQLYQEIHEQPQVLAHLLQANQQPVDTLAAAIKSQDLHHVIIAARGTSDNAARYAQYLLGARNRLVVTLATPSLFSIYQQPPWLKDALVLGISQSGQSPDIVAVLQEAQRQGALTAAITNQPESPLATTVDHVLPLHAGTEKSVAATKTYTAQLMTLAMLSVALNHDAAADTHLQAAPGYVAAALVESPDIALLAERYRYMQQCVVIGRGYNYATAFEMALKLKELTYAIVEPYSTADFLHGPLALLEPGFPVVVIAPTGLPLADARAFISTIQDREAEVIVISDDEATLAAGFRTLPLPPGVPEWLSPLTAIVPGQRLALHLAHTRGHAVDQPRGLRKVTETR